MSQIKQNICRFKTTFIICFSFFTMKTHAQSSEIKEFQSNKTKVFIGNGLPKSKGLKFSLKYPASYKLENIGNDVIVKGFLNEINGSMFFIGVVKKDEIISYEDKENILSKENMRYAISALDNNYQYLDYKKNILIDGKDASYLEYFAKISENTRSYFRQYFIISDDYLITISFGIPLLPKSTIEQTKTKFNNYKPLFDLVVGTFKASGEDEISKRSKADQRPDSSIYNRYLLNRFGIVYIPLGLDTFSQEIAKSEILESSIDRLTKSNQEKIKNKYNVNLTKSFFEESNKESYVFWPSVTILNVLDPKFWSFSTKDSSFGFDDKKIEFLPCITLRKVTVKSHSSNFKKHFFSNKDTTEQYVRDLENTVTGVFKQLYSEATLLEINSDYYLLDNEFPTVKISFYSSIPIGDEVIKIGQVLYMVFKNYGIYSLKFEFKLEERDKWEAFIKEIVSKSKLL